MGHYASEMGEGASTVGPEAEWRVPFAHLDLTVLRGEKNQYGRYETTLLMGGVPVTKSYLEPTFTPKDAARFLLKQWLR